jgi:large subunit ribosomal protein L31
MRMRDKGTVPGLLRETGPDIVLKREFHSVWVQNSGFTKKRACYSRNNIYLCAPVSDKVLQVRQKKKVMKTGIHPENYRIVAFKDMSNDVVFLTRSCAETKDTITYEGVEYPLVKMEISNTSHPYYTGKMKLVDTAGRIDKFRNRYDKKK